MVREGLWSDLISRLPIHADIQQCACGRNYAGCVERKLVFQNAAEYLVSLIGTLPCIQICRSFRIEVFRWH